ncbi:hemolysin activation/secretion protein [Aphanothece sacrum FPU3]|nr:hemolysin activation/secretion protein [Aphanothece sacrum FPU3]
MPSNSSQTITVQKFRFEGNTVFSEADLERVTVLFTGRPLTFGELLEARSAVTQLYVNQGYVTSGAYIPPQTMDQGLITIKIVEGTLEAINITVEGKLSPNYVRDRLALAGGTPLNVPRLLKALQLLQLNPLISQISAELSASPRPASNILTVKVLTARSFYAKILFDNGRNPQVGEIRRGAELSDINISGMGDTVQTTYYNTDGSDDIEVNYTVPVNVYNGTLKVGFRNLRGEIIEEPLDILEINSDYQKYSIKFRQPIWEAPSQELAVGVNIDHQKSRTRYLEGLPFPGRGSDNNGRNYISTLRFFQEWVTRSEAEVMAFRSEFDWGIDAFGTTVPFDIDVNPITPDGNYFLWRGQGQWVKLFAPDTLFIARIDLQLADRPIVSLEQFSLGGLNNVEGYRQNSLLTDNGVFGSLEFRIPIYRMSKDNFVVQIVPFANIGTGWNSGNAPNPSIDTLASIGLGLQVQYGNVFSARLDWANRLGKELLQNGNSLQDNGFLFTINISP